MNALTFIVIRSLFYVLGISLSSFLFANACLEKRKLWWLRYLGSTLLLMGLSVGLGCLNYSIIHAFPEADAYLMQTFSSLISYILLYVLLIFAIRLSFQGNSQEYFATLLFGGAMRHLIFSFYTCICYTLPIDLRFYSYNEAFNPWSIAIFIGVFLPLYVLAFLMIGKSGRSLTRIHSRTSSILFFVMVLYCLLLNTVAEVYSENYTVLFFLLFFSQIGICIFLFASQLLSSRHEESEQEKKLMEAMLSDKKHQYELSKQSIEQLNIRLHDLKHYRANKDIESSEIDSLIATHESFLHSGNEVVDTILGEKMLYAKDRGIALTCLVDGKSIAFLPPVEAYSLLGNILDNALEASEKIKDPSKASISLTIKKTSGGALIQCDNYFEDLPKVVDGRIASSKEDSSLHGFGLRSIAYLAEKHGGVYSYSTEGNIFHLSVSLSE